MLLYFVESHEHNFLSLFLIKEIHREGPGSQVKDWRLVLLFKASKGYMLY